MDFLTTHTNAALSEFEKVSDVTSECLQVIDCIITFHLFSSGGEKLLATASAQVKQAQK